MPKNALLVINRKNRLALLDNMQDPMPIEHFWLVQVLGKFVKTKLICYILSPFPCPENFQRHGF